MAATTFSRHEMIYLVTRRLEQSSLQAADPDLIARHLLSYYDYDLEKVLRLAV